MGHQRDPAFAAALPVQLVLRPDTQLLGTGEQHFEIVFAAMVIAVVGGIAPADARAGFVDAAAIVRLQMFAPAHDADVPLLFLDERDDVLVAEIPADVVVIFGRGGIVTRTSSRSS